MTELSVIVAIYKVEKYLRACVDSILSQPFRDLELILVDDGSPDRCPGICDEYARADARVRVIHQQNQGSVMARQAGLAVAKGTYVAFVDGDDWLDGDPFTPLIAMADQHHADVVTCGYWQGDGTRDEPRGNPLPSGVYEHEKLAWLLDRALFTGTYYEPGIIPALWNKLFRQSTLVQSGIRPHEMIRMGDDAALTFPLLLRASCVVVANEIRGYHYRVTEGSLSRSADPLYFERMFHLIDGLDDALKSCPSMERQLSYYTLFLTEIGMDQLFARRSLLHPLELKKRLEQIMHRLQLKKRLHLIDYALLNPAQEKRARALAQEGAGKYMRIMLAEKLRQKLRKSRN